MVKTAIDTLKKTPPGVLLGALLLLPLVYSNPYHVRILGTIGLYVLLALGLNVVVGFAGLLDLGYIAFYAIGAYTYAVLASPHFGLHYSFWVLLPLSILAAMLLGVLLGFPTLRLRGDYLAIVTLGFGEIIRILLQNLDRPINITGGPNGIIKIDPPSILGFELGSVTHYYYLILLLVLLSIYLLNGLQDSKIGRAWRAIKDDETAAGSMGVDTRVYKLLAFAIGAAFAGMAGAVFAAWQGAVFPVNFSFAELVAIFCMVVLGGTGSIAGSILGAALLVAVPELLREYSVYRMLIYGPLLVLAMRYRPQGLVGFKEKPEPTAVPRDVEASLPVPSRKGTGGEILRLEGLSKSFGGLKAVDNVSLSVRKGEIVSIIGPNGAGKTTLFNLVTGLIRPDQGRIIFKGRDISGLPKHEVNSAGMARTFQNIRVFSEMTVLENVLVGRHNHIHSGAVAASMRLSSAKREESLNESIALSCLAFFGPELLGKANKKVASLSYADRRRVEIARAIATEPEVLLLDEPAAGMNPAEAAEMTRQVLKLRDRGFTIILVEHQMSVVMGISDRVIVLDQGRVIAEGRPEEVQRNRRVIEAYLGTGRRHFEVSPAPLDEESRRPLLSLTGVDAHYGQVQVLRDVNLTVGQGEIVCLLGSNSAGKTTTIKTIVGTVKPTAGSIVFNGKDLSGLTAPDIVRLGISVVPEGRRIFGRLTVEENLRMGAYTQATEEARREGFERVFDLFPRLKERLHQKAGTLSGGEQQMLAIGRALMTTPRLLLLDEPSMGLSPLLVEAVFEAILKIRGMGITVLMVEQNASMALDIADYGYVLRSGQVILSGPARVLKDDTDMQRAYLGG